MPGVFRIGVIAKREAVEADVLGMLVDKLTEVVDETAQSTSQPIAVVSTLAAGASCIMVERALQLGLTFEAVIPYAGYADAFETGGQRSLYHRLVGRARKVTLLPYGGPSDKAYDSAARTIIDQSDLVFVVWDGDEASDTARAMIYGHQLGKRSVMLNVSSDHPTFVLTGV